MITSSHIFSPTISNSFSFSPLKNFISSFNQSISLFFEEINSAIIVSGISTDVIKDFDVEKAICNINNYKDATISPGAIATVYAHNQQINPIEKVVELYERLLKSEQEKIEILRECIKQGK